MTSTIRMSLCAAGALLLAACATPTVVDVAKIGDEGLSCAALRAEYEEASRLQREAESEKGVNTRNVASALFFWPSLVGTYMNSNDAIEAAKDRKAHLLDIMRNKQCDGYGG